MEKLHIRFVEGSKPGTLKYEMEGEGTVQVANLQEMNPQAGQEWYCTLQFDEGKGKRRERIVRLLSRVDAEVDISKLNLDGFYIKPRALRNIIIFVMCGEAIILRGPSGTGKTTFPRHLAKAMGLKLVKVDVGLKTESTDFFGKEGAKDGSTTFSLSEMGAFLKQAEAEETKADGKITHLLQLDELNRVHARIISSALHGLFDDTREVTVSTTSGSQTIRLPRNVATIGTINPNDHRYGGTYALDDAMLSRTVVVDFDYPPREEEVKMLLEKIKQRGRNIQEGDAVRIVDVASHLREGCAQGLVSKAIDPRDTIRTAMLVSYGVPVLEAIEDVMLQKYEGRREAAESERGHAWALIRAKDVGSALRKVGS